MPSPEVTITLGRSRQIVKRKRPDLDSVRTGSHQSSLRARLGNGSGASSSSYSNKRYRQHGSGSHWNDDDCDDDDGLDGTLLGRDDLRLRLMRRREARSRAVNANEPREANRGEVAVARSPMNCNTLRRDLEPRSSSHAIRSPPRESKRSSLYINSSRNVYTTRDDSRPRSPPRSHRRSRSYSPRPCRNEYHNPPPLRPADTLTAHRILRSDVHDPIRSAVPTHVMVPTAAEAARPLTHIPSSSGTMQRPMYMGEGFLTVVTLLNNIGLGKYAINFQAEEVDMHALKQMGEKDLKDIGIPMGPRKKILQALMALSKRQQQLQARQP